MILWVLKERLKELIRFDQQESHSFDLPMILKSSNKTLKVMIL